MTRSLSSGLVKQIYTVVQSEEKRIINTNELIRRRFGTAFEKEESATGFSSGLQAELVELDPAAENTGENIIKAAVDEEKLFEEAQESSRELLENARTEAEKLLEEARRQAEAEKNGILEEARKQGYAEGESRARLEQEAALQEYRRKESELEELYQQRLNEMEPQLVETITQIYEKIFHVDLRTERDILVYLIADTLRRADGEKNFIIHVSNVDYPYVNAQREQTLADAIPGSCCLEVIADMTLAEGECMIETDGGIFDCGLGTQLEELRRRLTLLSWQKD